MPWWRMLGDRRKRPEVELGGRRFDRPSSSPCSGSVLLDDASRPTRRPRRGRGRAGAAHVVCQGRAARHARAGRSRRRSRSTASGTSSSSSRPSSSSCSRAHWSTPSSSTAGARTRTARRTTPSPSRRHGNFKLEVGWTIAPAVILVFVAVYTVSVVFALEDRDDDAVPVDVIGQQWWWEYRYDVDELIDAGLIPDQEYERDADRHRGRDDDPRRPARWTSTSPPATSSTASGFPALNGKRDAVPGRNSTLSMQADEPGSYLGQVHRVLRSVPLPHAHVGPRHPRRRVHRVGGQPAGRRRTARRCLGARRRGVGDLPFRRARPATWSTAVAPARPGWGNEDLYDPNNVQPSSRGRAPDLTHFMNRPRYAGAIFDLYDGRRAGVHRLPLRPRDLPAQRPRGLAQEPAGPEGHGLRIPREPDDRDLIKPRGMPDLDLNDEQVDALVEYLTTLQ